MVKQCTWIGDGEGCAQSAVEGRSYCEAHLWQVYKQGSAVRRKKDTRIADTVRLWTSLMDEAVQELEDEGYDFGVSRWNGDLASDSVISDDSLFDGR